MKTFQFSACALLPITLAYVVGCSGVTGPTLIPVTGTVLVNGKPVANATVSFWAEAAPRAANGTTDADGKFTLSMFEPNDGAIPGSNVVTVTKEVKGAATTSNVEAMLSDPSAMAGMASKNKDNKIAPPPKSEIPLKYGNQSTSPLKEVISAANNKVILQLTEE